MTSTLAASFRALFRTFTILAALSVVLAAGLVWYAGYGLPLALGFLVGGGILLVACFGLVAIQMENNELLAVIAESLADVQDAPAASPAARLSPPRADAPLMLRPAAAAPQPAAAAPRGRVEPVLTARRG